MQRLCALDEIADGGLHALEVTAPVFPGDRSAVGRVDARQGASPESIAEDAAYPHSAAAIARSPGDPGAMGDAGCSADGLQPGDGLIAYRCGDEVRLWHNICPHAGRRLDWASGRFLRDGQDLVCSHHGAVFELGEGRCISGPCRGQSLTAVASTVRDGVVWLDV